MRVVLVSALWRHGLWRHASLPRFGDVQNEGQSFMAEWLAIFKIVYLFIIYSTERPVWAILLNDVDCIKGPTSTPEVMINHH